MDAKRDESGNLRYEVGTLRHEIEDLRHDVEILGLQIESLKLIIQTRVDDLEKAITTLPKRKRIRSTIKHDKLKQLMVLRQIG